jgi:hypothetical protein
LTHQQPHQHASQVCAVPCICCLSSHSRTLLTRRMSGQDYSGVLLRTVAAAFCIHCLADRTLQEIGH